MTNDVINNSNLNVLLNAFAKEYKKQRGNTPIEITIVGGGSILINYGFRNMTQDFDIATRSPGALKDVIVSVANKFGLPSDWMNEDFRFTKSYSPKIEEISKFYRSLNNGIITIRTVDAEYLIAMKMQSGREFGNDIPDIIGVLKYETEKGNPLTFEQIMSAGNYLYGKDFNISNSLKERVESYTKMSSSELAQQYEQNVTKANKIQTMLLSENVGNREKAKSQAIEIEQTIT